MNDDVPLGTVNPVITVATASNTRDHRKWDKYNYCVFCQKPFPKLPIHFSKKHFTKPEVTEVFSYVKKSRARQVLLMKLTNKGDYEHNTEVLKAGQGVLIPYRRPVVQWLGDTTSGHCSSYVYKGLTGNIKDFKIS